MKRVLILFVFVVPIISISVNNCRSLETAYKIPLFQCEIVNFIPINVRDILSVILCFQNDVNFTRVAMQLHHDKEFQYIYYLNDTSLEEGLNEVDFRIKKIKDRLNPNKYEFKTFINGIEKSSKQLENWQLNKKTMFLSILGWWEGESEFIALNESHSSNCPQNRQSITTKMPLIGSNDITAEEMDPITGKSNTLSEAYVFYAVGAAILIVGIVCLIVIFLACRKNRNAKKAAKVSNIRSEHLPEVPDSTSNATNTNIHQKLDDAPHYANIPPHGESSEGDERAKIDETDDVTYLELDFGAAKRKPDKPKKVGKKGPKTANKIEREPSKGNEETIYASIEPEIMLDKESVAYANVGEYLSGNSNNRNLDEVIYANVNY